MGLMYSPSESEGLVNALRSNIATAQTMIDDMNNASRHLVDAVNGKTLSGAAYTAGKGLFTELVIPTISKAAATVDKLRKKLSQYEGYAGAAGNELLDEDKLNRQLELLRQQQVSMTSQINFYRIQSYLYPEEAELNQMYANFQWELSNYLNTIADDIQKTQDKLKRLHEFNGNVNGLFSGISQEMKLIVQSVLILNNLNINRNGGYTFPVGVDASWFNDLATSTVQTTVIEKLTSIGESKIAQKATERGAQKVANIWASRYSIKLPDGRILGKTPGATKLAIEGVEKSAETFGKFAGKAVTGGLSLGVGVGLDMLNGDTAEEAWGKEITTTTVIVGGIAVAGLIVGAPVELPLAALVGIGVGVGFLNDKLRENFKGVKDFEDSIGNAVVSSWNSLTKGVGNFFGGALG